MPAAEVVGHFLKCLMRFEAQCLLIGAKRLLSKVGATDRRMIGNNAPKAFKEPVTALYTAV